MDIVFVNDDTPITAILDRWIGEPALANRGVVCFDMEDIYPPSYTLQGVLNGPDKQIPPNFRNKHQFPSIPELDPRVRRDAKGIVAYEEKIYLDLCERVDEITRLIHEHIYSRRLVTFTDVLITVVGWIERCLPGRTNHLVADQYRQRLIEAGALYQELSFTKPYDPTLRHDEIKMWLKPLVEQRERVQAREPGLVFPDPLSRNNGLTLFQKRNPPDSDKERIKKIRRYTQPEYRLRKADFSQYIENHIGKLPRFSTPQSDESE